MSEQEQVLLTELIDQLRSLRLAIEREQESRDKYDGPLTREAAAEYLGIHKDTLYRWAVVEGRIAYSRLGDGVRAPIRFARKDLDDFLRRVRIPTVEEMKSTRSRKGITWTSAR